MKKNRNSPEPNADLLKLRGSLKDLSPSLLKLSTMFAGGDDCGSKRSNLASISFKLGGRTVSA